MPATPLRERKAWQALERHYAEISGTHLRDLFAADPGRGERLTAEAVGIYLDYSKNRITDETLALLIELAEESGVAERRDAMFRGEHINVSENRAVLHTALRLPATATLVVDGQDVVADVHAVLARMRDFADRVRSGEFKGYTGKPIKNVINVGIGGSDLGPVMAYEALKHYCTRDITFRFVSNVDSTDFVEAVRDLSADETLFIISSKTFGTLETLTNADLGQGLGRRPPSGRRMRWRTTSSRCPPTPSGSRHSGSTRRTCSGSGTGSAAGTRWTPPSGCPR